jgi:hypothetical protein
VKGWCVLFNFVLFMLILSVNNVRECLNFRVNIYRGKFWHVKQKLLMCIEGCCSGCCFTFYIAWVDFKKILESTLGTANSVDFAYHNITLNLSSNSNFNSSFKTSSKSAFCVLNVLQFTNFYLEEMESTPEPPFPWFAMSAICLGMLAHSVVFTSPLPFVAFMVVDFGMTNNVDSAGYSAGWITGAFMIGRTIAALPWGIASDKWGRKPCLVMSMVNVAVIGLMFGFSTNFAMAVSLRFLMGLGNGFMCVAKTCLSEIVTTKEHELRAFGYLGSFWGLGIIVGPAIGGLLARPALQYPTVFSEQSIWGRFPYLLPSLICASIAALAAVMIIVGFTETLGTNTSRSGGGGKPTTTAVSSPLQSDLENGGDSSSSSPGKDSPLSDSSLTISSVVKDSPFSVLSHEDDEEEDDGDRSEGDEDGLQLTTLSSNVSRRRDETVSPLQKINWSVLPTTLSSAHSRGGHKYASLDVEEKGGIGSGDVTTDDNDSIDSLKISSHNKDTTHSHHNTSDAPTVTAKPSSMTAILASLEVRHLFGIYLFVSFLVMFNDEAVPLWGATSLHRGGLAWDSAEVVAILLLLFWVLMLFV